MSYQCYPEYEFYTGVELTLEIGGDASKTLVVSKIGEHFLSMSITEGTVSESGQQLADSNNSGGVSTGTITLLDEDNSIFLSLLSSKSSEGDPLENMVNITIKTYTGSRSYRGLVTKWDCSFDGGAPRITLSWRSVGSSAAPDNANTNKGTYKVDLLKKLLIDEGVSDFKEFKEAVKQIFMNVFQFCYSPSVAYTVEGLKEIPDSGEIVYYTDNNEKRFTLSFPSSVMERNGEEKWVYRMTDLRPVTDTSSLILLVMDKFCSAVNVASEIKIDYDLVDGNKIFIFAYTGEKTKPQPYGTSSYLDDTVFVYNSSLSQGSDFQLPDGSKKKVFVIQTIKTSFDFSHLIVTNLQEQANSSNPNGNMVITSRGGIMIPTGMPDTIAESIKKITSVQLADSFTVSMSCFNFIHFYVLGETLINLVVYDHLGRVHPITGKMRVHGYQYSISTSGVIRADVILKPPFDGRSLNWDFLNQDVQGDVASQSQVDVNNGAVMSQTLSLDSSIDYQEVSE